MPSLGNALQELRRDRTATQLRLERLDQIISGIESLNGTGHSHKATQPTPVVRGKRIMSAAARRKISMAQKARWAKQNGQAPKPRRKMSAAGRKRIAAAQKARWAKVRAAEKKAA